MYANFCLPESFNTPLGFELGVTAGVKADGYVQNEGDIGVKPKKGPYKIAYGSLVPKQEECVNLLVPICVSSSHIAFGSIRMEPVFMILGQSAALAEIKHKI